MASSQSDHLPWPNSFCSLKDFSETDKREGEGMWNPRGNDEKLVAVAIDKDKRSQNALKWALDHVLTRGQTVKLVHVDQQQLPNAIPSGSNDATTSRQDPHEPTTDVFLPFRCFCSRREVLWETVTLEEQDIAKALIDYVSFNRIDTLVLGAPSRNGITRLFKTDHIPSAVLKGAPYFCSVYIISKGKVASLRAASHPLPISTSESTRSVNCHSNDDIDLMGRAAEIRLHDEFAIPDTDISFVSSGRLSTDSTFYDFYDILGSHDLSRRSPSTEFDLLGSGKSKFNDLDYTPDEFSPTNKETGIASSSKLSSEELEEKLRRLEQQMNQTMDMYHAACKEALTAKQKVRELQRLRMEDEKRLGEAERVKEDARMIAEEEKEKCMLALKLAKAAYRKAERESQKRFSVEIKAFKGARDHKQKMIDSLGQSHMVLKYQSLLHIMVVFFIFYFYFFELR